MVQDKDYHGNYHEKSSDAVDHSDAATVHPSNEKLPGDDGDVSPISRLASPRSLDGIDGSNGSIETSAFPRPPPSTSFRTSEDREHEDGHDHERLADDLELIRAERAVTQQLHGVGRQRSRQPGGADANAAPDDNDAFHSVPETPPPAYRNTDAALYRLKMWLQKVPRFFRYFFYLTPGAVVLLAPVLVGYFSPFGSGHAAVGGRYGPDLMWFGIWLEIVWCSLWVSRMIASIMPPLFKAIARAAGSVNPRKWYDIGRGMELHVSLFAWWLAVLVSFEPIMNNHRAEYRDGAPVSVGWIDVVNKVIIALFVLVALNVVEKILIQWIAAAFHQRTYATRIENHKADVANLVCLFEYSNTSLAPSYSAGWPAAATPPGARTPLRTLQLTARTALSKVGVVAKGIGNDFVGRRSVTKDQPKKVAAELLRTQHSCHVMARFIYRALVKPGSETVLAEDMLPAFGDDMERAEAAFAMFDKDMNGDISVDEFMQVCNEISLEKKAIAASLKDLSSVIQKLDKVFLFVIVVVAIVVFISIISTSAAAALASASTSILALSWVLQATAQEFLQSIIFVFVKHPFDVGDRVTVYGNTGATLKGDDYYVTAISLLYTEFKKMEGHIVQAPNSLLNTLFILNQRRSNGIADVNPLRMRFGTPVWMIEELKSRMLSFCLANKRDYQGRIITEVVSIEDVRATTVNFIFFHKSNYQNELLRLVRHNKFIAELQAQMVEIGIEGPQRVDPGGSREAPAFVATMGLPPAYATVYPNPYPGNDAPKLVPPTNESVTPQTAVPVADNHHDTTTPLDLPPTTTATLHTMRARSRSRAESAAGIAAHAMQPIAEEHLDDFQDVFESRRDARLARRTSMRERMSPLHTETPNTAVESSSGLNLAPTTPSIMERVGSLRQFSRTRRESSAQAAYDVSAV